VHDRKPLTGTDSWPSCCDCATWGHRAGCVCRAWFFCRVSATQQQTTHAPWFAGLHTGSTGLAHTDQWHAWLAIGRFQGNQVHEIAVSFAWRCWHDHAGLLLGDRDREDTLSEQWRLDEGGLIHNGHIKIYTTDVLHRKSEPTTQQSLSVCLPLSDAQQQCVF
jgi:hypothetical protein